MAEPNDAAIRRARRLGFFAHYHPAGIVSDAVLLYLDALARAGFTLVVLSTATLPEPEQAKLRGACDLLIMRENRGLDFGGWQDAVARFFPIEADLLLLANDSVYGPLHDLEAFVASLLAVQADFYGAVESDQFGAHLQSWFVLLRPAAYRSMAFRELMARTIPAAMAKWDIIMSYEIGLTRQLVAAGLTYHAAYRSRDLGLLAPELGFNPPHVLWRELIAGAGIPFIKIELLRDAPIAAGRIGDWRRFLAGADPRLLPAIEIDVALRRGRSIGAIRRAQLASVKGLTQSLFWWAKRGVLRRDFGPRDRAGAAHRAIAAAFRARRRGRAR